MPNIEKWCALFAWMFFEYTHPALSGSSLNSSEELYSFILLMKPFSLLLL